MSASFRHVEARELTIGQVVDDDDVGDPAASGGTVYVGSDHGLVLAEGDRIPADAQLLATNDLHYTKAEDSTAHAALLCVQSGSTLMDPGRFKFDAEEFYLKSPAQMRELLRELPEACDNTLAIAERCTVDIELDQRLIPRYPTPDVEPESAYLRRLVDEGVRARYGSPPPAAALAFRKPRREALTSREAWSGLLAMTIPRRSDARRRLRLCDVERHICAEQPAFAGRL